MTGGISTKVQCPNLVHLQDRHWNPVTLSCFGSLEGLAPAYQQYHSLSSKTGTMRFESLLFRKVPKLALAAPISSSSRNLQPKIEWESVCSSVLSNDVDTNATFLDSMMDSTSVLQQCQEQKQQTFVGRTACTLGTILLQQKRVASVALERLDVTWEYDLWTLEEASSITTTTSIDVESIVSDLEGVMLEHLGAMMQLGAGDNNNNSRYQDCANEDTPMTEEVWKMQSGSSLLTLDQLNRLQGISSVPKDSVLMNKGKWQAPRCCHFRVQRFVFFTEMWYSRCP